jgi:hypothetical protein
MGLRRRTSITLACVLLALPIRTAAGANVEQETFDAAVYLLKTCMQVRRDGQHHVRLRALRHLADPEMAPLFNSLIDSPYAPFKIHGFLGAAECKADKQLDLTRLAEVKESADQAQIISMAMDSKLLSDEQALQIINWDGMDNGIKAVVAMQLLKVGKFHHRAILEKATESENLARQYLGYLLLGQYDDPGALARLEQLNESDDPKRDRLREMLLRTAVQHNLTTIGPWALRLSGEPQLRRSLRLLGLKTALRFDAPGAMAAWRNRYESATDLSGRRRLALLVLELSPQLEAELFEPLIRSDDDFIQQLGKTGQAVASKRRVAMQVLALLEMGYPIANAWALQYARDQASDEDAAAILIALIRAFEIGPERGRSQRLDDAVSATQVFFDRDPDAATKFLRAALSAPQADPLLIQGILLGLIRCRTSQPQLVLADLPPFEQSAARNLALLLRARFGQGLSPEALGQLGSMVRGSGLQHGALRVQAAWLYLKITNQVEPALIEVLSN